MKTKTKKKDMTNDMLSKTLMQSYSAVEPIWEDIIEGHFICPYCGIKFKAEYPSKTILGDWKHNAQLASSNYKKHKEKCKNLKTQP